MTDPHDMDTRFELDDRQRAMLAEMGVRVWMPKSKIPATVPAEDAAPTPVSKAVPAVSPVQSTASPPNMVTVPVVDISALPEGIAQMDWAALQSAVLSCTGCGLSQGRQQAIPGEGPATADWMVVGDAPGEDEDKAGTSFAGPAGQLLDNMLKALRLSRADVYITHALKCRTPVGRSASQVEVSHCATYLARQVALVRPKVILAMGRTAALALLQSTEPLGKLRSDVQSFHGVPVVVTYPPAYLLRNQADKAKAWTDLCRAASLVQS
ncbi:MAG: uracil-DNA glycosylase [Betaproteobacteria bacterium]|nr:uracil-DNA glycosylase [Betaproteobacteria bacterium]